MSKYIICPNCQTENLPDSKFCRNCGNALPKSTKRICPNCFTPNAQNRLYCDNCGTKLVQEEPLPPQPEEEPEKQKPVSGSDYFSLPTRPPGETGELDLLNVPDWLRTGGTPPEDQPEEETEEEAQEPRTPAKTSDLPRLEDLAPNVKQTDELPDWLIDSQSEELVISPPPPEITTEHFLHLVQEDDADQEGYFVDDETISGDEADLPDWLAEFAQPAGNEPENIPSETGLLTSDELLETAEPATTEPDQPTGFTEFLSDLDEFEEEPEPTETAEPATTEPDQPTGLTEFLTDLEGFDVDALTSPSDTDKTAESEEENIPSWFTDLQADEDDNLTAQILAETDDESESEPTLDWADTLDQPTITTSEEESEAFARLFDEPDEPTPTPTTEPEPETSTIEELPDWLAGLEGENELIASEQSETGDFLDDLMAEESDPTATALDWLVKTGELQLPDQDIEAEFEEILADLSEEPIEETAPSNFESTPADEPSLDWLSELATIDTGELLAEQAKAESEPVEEPAELEAELPEPELPTAEWEAEPPSSEEEILAEEPAFSPEEWSAEEQLFDEEVLLEEEIPDWLEQLGPPPASSEPPASDEDLIPSEELPDWVAEMRPGIGRQDSLLPNARISPPELLEGLEEEDALIDAEIKAELPEWLQDVPLSPENIGEGIPPATGESSDWLEEGVEGVDTTSEWTAILRDLPSAQTVEDELVKADIPEWVQALKPDELTKPASEEEEEASLPVQTSGPLSGLRGVIEIEPVIAMPRTVAPLQQFGVLPEQEKQATLLRQLAQNGMVSQTAVSMPAPKAIGAGLRLLLVLLLLAAAMIGASGILPVSGANTAVPPHVTAIHSTITNTTDQSVLVVFDYTPALAGELSPQAELILNQLANNGNTILAVSQYPAGIGVIQNLTAEINVIHLGLLPGEAVGLRQLRECLQSCTQLTGETLSPDVQSALQRTGVVIIFTGERTSLVNWIEQVGTLNDVTILAGVTAALAPVAQPYADTGQLTGFIGGGAETAVYSQLASSTPATPYQSALPQLVAALLLLVGGIFYGIVGVAHRQKT